MYCASQQICTPMTEMGRVARVTEVQRAVRNCTRDEGRSFEVGNQVLISSHRKLLSSKAMVVNVAEKSERARPIVRRGVTDRPKSTGRPPALLYWPWIT